MKSFIKHSVMLLLAAALAGCAHRSTRTQDPIQQDREKIKQTLSSEISLAKDRAELAELRKNIPEDTQRENDELALIAPLMAQPQVEPSRIRQQFQYAVQKKRETFSRKVKKLRDDFTKEERKERDAFLKTAQEKRKAVDPKKMERSEINERYKELDKERRDFFSEQRERRKSFEAEINAQTKDFNDYMRDKSRDFNDQIREYTRRYNDMKKSEKEKRQSEFEMMKTIPSEPLTPQGP
jgi:hypothetical protein